jgi:hypothetical protein
MTRTVAAAALVLSGCLWSAGPAHEVVLDIANNRDEPLVVRIAPEIVAGDRVASRSDAGVGEGHEVAAGERATLRLAVNSDRWTVTVNGVPAMFSSDPDVAQGGRTRARLVVDEDEQTLQVIPAADASGRPPP